LQRSRSFYTIFVGIEGLQVCYLLQNQRLIAMAGSLEWLSACRGDWDC
jgi:hypothetical protein